MHFKTIYQTLSILIESLIFILIANIATGYELVVISKDLFSLSLDGPNVNISSS